MIKVLFFASLREQLDTAELEVNLAAGETVAALRQRLCAQGGELWQELLGADNVISAVNLEVVDDSQPLADGDEVAFYPPVTGG